MSLRSTKCCASMLKKCSSGASRFEAGGAAAFRLARAERASPATLPLRARVSRSPDHQLAQPFSGMRRSIHQPWPRIGVEQPSCTGFRCCVPTDRRLYEMNNIRSRSDLRRFLRQVRVTTLKHSDALFDRRASISPRSKVPSGNSATGEAMDIQYAGSYRTLLAGAIFSSRETSPTARHCGIPGTAEPQSRSSRD
jgi:hypothetical protein